MPIPGAYIAEEVAPWIDDSGKIVPASGSASDRQPEPAGPASGNTPPQGQAQQHSVQPQPTQGLMSGYVVLGPNLLGPNGGGILASSGPQVLTGLTPTPSTSSPPTLLPGSLVNAELADLPAPVRPMASNELFDINKLRQANASVPGYGDALANLASWSSAPSPWTPAAGQPPNAPTTAIPGAATAADRRVLAQSGPINRGLLGGVWPPVKNPLTFRPQVEGNKLYNPQKLTASQLRELVHPALEGRGANRFVSTLVSDALSAVPGLGQAVSALQVQTQLAIDRALATTGAAALAQASRRPETAFVLTVTYTTTKLVGAAPAGPGIGAARQLGIGNVVAYVYWIK